MHSLPSIECSWNLSFLLLWHQHHPPSSPSLSSSKKHIILETWRNPSQSVQSYIWRQCDKGSQMKWNLLFAPNDPFSLIKVLLFVNIPLSSIASAAVIVRCLQAKSLVWASFNFASTCIQVDHLRTIYYPFFSSLFPYLSILVPLLSPSEFFKPRSSSSEPRTPFSLDWGLENLTAHHCYHLWRQQRQCGCQSLGLCFSISHRMSFHACNTLCFLHRETRGKPDFNFISGCTSDACIFGGMCLFSRADSLRLSSGVGLFIC